MEDWCTMTDYLRYSPGFHHNERRDFVLVHHSRLRIAFAQLVHLFTCKVGSIEYSLALIQVLERDSRSAEVKRVDKSVATFQLHMRPRSQCEVIPLHAIIRGTLLVADSKYKGDYFVIDMIDTDMYLRVAAMDWWQE